MKTRMKKLISISTIPVLTLTLLLVLGTVMADDPAIKPAPNLACTIEYWWMPGWKGTISGDIEGVIIWYPGADPMRYAGQTSHYDGSFEIYDVDPVVHSDAVLLLAAYSPVGSTTVRHGKNSIWRTSGTVTDAGPGLEDWIGRRVHQNGHFTWDEFGAPEHGMGTLRVN